MSVLGLDVGGANLKAALSTGQAASRPFPLYKQPADLKAALKLLTGKLPAPQRLAVTMTGELCDCFATKKEGVRHILASVADAFPGLPLSVYTTHGAFVSREQAEAAPLVAASANWLALATFAGRFAPTGDALLVDVGTTTTDLVPLKDGIPVPIGRTDPERLKSCELVYRGWRRTPLCALYPEGAAEFFATTHDVCLGLGLISDNANDTDTADGKPATRPFALARLARMACADRDTMSEEECLNLARLLHGRLLADIRRPVRPVTTVVLSGSGAFLLEDDWPDAVRLRDEIGPEASEAACAYAVAKLAEG
jgi:probable H4MPT-linked C1 transfer pathway protein